MEAEESARREKDSLRERDVSDRERFAAQRTKVQLYTRDLEQIRGELLTLEDSQTEAADASAALTEQMTQQKTEKAALEAERATAENHIQDLGSLQPAMEGDREKKLLLIDTLRKDQLRLEQEIAQLKLRQQDNDKEAAQMTNELQKLQQIRMESEASKTKAEREAQEKNKDILNMARACAQLVQKKGTSAMEEGQIFD